MKPVTACLVCSVGMLALAACDPDQRPVTRSDRSATESLLTRPVPAPHDPSDVVSSFGVPFDPPDGCPATPVAADADDQKKLERFSWLIGRGRLGYAAIGPALDEIRKGNIDTSLKMAEMLERSATNRTQQSFAAAVMSLALTSSGNLRRAQSKAGEARAQGSDTNPFLFRLVALAEVAIREASGDYLGAEATAKRAIETLRLTSSYDEGIALFWERIARSQLLQGRVNEAEAALRAASAGRQFEGLSVDGASVASLFAAVLLQRNLPGPALHMAKLAANKLETACVAQTSLLYNDSLQSIAKAHLALRDWTAVVTTFEAIRRNLESLPEVYLRRYATDPALPWAILQLGDAAGATVAAEAGMVAAGRVLGPASADYLRNRAIRRLAQRADSADADGARRAHGEIVDEGVVNLGSAKDPLGKRFENEILHRHFRDLIRANLIEEAFSVSDTLRGGAVQQAIANASLRAAVRDSRLQDLVRDEQDTAFQIEALGIILVNAVSGIDTGRPPTQIRSEIEALQARNARTRSDIERNFRSYSNLIRPRAPTAADVKSALNANEAFVSVAVEPDRTVVWVVGKHGGTAFHIAQDWGADRVKDAVVKLRRALAPDVSSIGEIPPLDLELAYELYSGLFAPVAAAWAEADTLIFSTTGALAGLPLHMLPTRPSTRRMPESLLFAGYRDVAWLIREKAVAYVSTAVSFADLRAIESPSAPVRVARREAFVGFGDPLFNSRQLAEFERDARNGGTLSARSRLGTLRAVGRDEEGQSWETRAPDGRYLRALSRLPETATEIRSIARELDASDDGVFLGLKANEEAVRRSNLSSSRVLMFATHGLMAGDLPGLHEPALAMTAPDLAGTTGDGFLTMSEIMTLKLDADWVILSACNTAAADGRGAESASGLGRAFFYAGARAVLLTHWAVESTSAEAITTRIFQNQARQRTASRAALHRMAMLDVMSSDASAVSAEGRFSYAHPFFWAAFALTGDPGNPSR